jgi:cellulose synthase/poly-beta-1,6-N-acetylglucosamine synthase-like glycosyltransferase
VEFLAQLDADTVPHRTWLRELATALAEEGIGVATGNRWYMPDQATWGALVRYSWNAAAVVQMYWYHIAWGGTLAIKTRVIRELKLLERWSRAFCEDTMLFRLLRENGWRLAFVPSLMMINRETCDLAGFRRWVQRQLLTARLYHPHWPAVAAHGVMTSVAQLAALVLIPVAWLTGRPSAAWLLVAGLILYHGSMLLMLIPLEWSVRRIAAARSEQTNWLDVATAMKLVWAIPLTQIIYPWVLALAMRLRWVDWRGVSYEVAGPWDVRLIEYRPFDQPPDTSAVSAISL